MDQLNFRYKKPVLSIKTLGKMRFFLGVFAGILVAIVISFSFNFFRETERFFSIVSGDLLVFNPEKKLFYDRFFAFFGAVLGLSISIWFWLNTYFTKDIKKQRILITARTNILFVFFIYLFVITDFSSKIPSLFFKVDTYEMLNLYKNLPYLFYLIIIVIFFQNWLYVQRIFIAWKWMFWSGILVVILGFTLPYFTKVHKPEIDENFYNINKNFYEYIDRSVLEAKTVYGVSIDSNTVQILKKWRGNEVSQQLNSVVNAFKREKPVSLDTILLGKINFYVNKSDQGMLSILPLRALIYPKYVYIQIKKYPPDAKETKALFELLKDQIEITKVKRDTQKNFDLLRFRRATFAEIIKHSPYYIKHLQKAKSLLINDLKYSERAKKLPKIDIIQQSQN